MSFFSFFPGLLKLDERKKMKEVKAKKIVIHPDHTVQKEVHDICVVQLNQAQSVSSTIRPICLPAKGTS
jgi:hypothetical protein